MSESLPIKRPALSLLKGEERASQNSNASLEDGVSQFAAIVGDTGSGWFKAMRSGAELLAAHKNAYVLAIVIAHRAKWRDGFNRHGLGQGEAMLGDYKNYGMTHREYRTACDKLATWGFATFKTTNAGTVGRLIDSRLFSTSFEATTNEKTCKRQTSDKQATTNEEGKKGIRKEGTKQVAALLTVLPEGLQTEAFKEAWSSWLEHLKQKRKPPTAHSQALQLKKLAAMGERTAIATVNHCIEHNWQGIFEMPKAAGAMRTGSTIAPGYVSDHRGGSL